MGLRTAHRSTVAVAVAVACAGLLLGGCSIGGGDDDGAEAGDQPPEAPGVGGGGGGVAFDELPQDVCERLDLDALRDELGDPDAEVPFGSESGNSCALTSPGDGALNVRAAVGSVPDAVDGLGMSGAGPDAGEDASSVGDGVIRVDNPRSNEVIYVFEADGITWMASTTVGDDATSEAVAGEVVAQLRS